ncbi:MAG: NepR family anti-sigma factor [Steroidobacteraceae bacterium]|nr:NepR family anti-sigma factor [Steroidobacteraceae bacterium]
MARARVAIEYIPMIMSEKTKPSEPPTSATAGPPEQVPDWLSNRLRRMFTEVMDEPVPDEFKALLRQLEEKERSA